MLKKIIFVLFGVALVVFSIFLEDFLDTNSKSGVSSIITFPATEEFVIRTDQDRNWHERQEGELPRYIRAEQLTSLQIASNLEIELAPQTIIKVVSLNNKLIHLRLIDGRIAYDNRVPIAQLLFIQTDQVAIEPSPFSQGQINFTNGDLVTLQQQQGAQTVTLFDANLAQREFLLTEQSTVELRESEIDDDLILADPYTLYALINLGEQYQAQSNDSFPAAKIVTVLEALATENQTNPIPNFLERYVFASRKKIALQQGAIITNLQAAINQLRVNQTSAAEATLQTVSQQLKELERLSATAYQDHLQQLLMIFGGVPEQSRLYAIKSTILAEALLTVRTEADILLVAQAASNTPEILLNHPNLKQIFEDINFAPTQTESSDITTLNHLGILQLIKTPKLVTDESLSRLYGIHTQMVTLWPEVQDSLYAAFANEVIRVVNGVLSSEDIPERIKNQTRQQTVETLEFYHNNSNISQNFQDFLNAQLITN